jgi:glycosyltransferase involved in cell wall biosynthesis
MTDTPLTDTTPATPATGTATLVSIVIPIYNEAGYIARCLASVLANDTLPEPLDIVVVDGMSTDGTRDIVREISQSHPNVRLIDNPEKTVPYAMNRGIAAARGDVIIRVDGHAEIARDFVARALEALAAHPECACVGGVTENAAETAVGKAIALAMASRFGVGNVAYRLGERDGYVDTLLYGAYRKSVFDDIGLFDPVLTRNQDDDLNFRLTRAGHKIWMSRDIRARYVVRPDYRKLFKQHRQYGYWKVYVGRKHGTVTTLRQLVPPAFVLTLLLLFVAALFSGVALALLGGLVAVYVAAGLLEAFRLAEGAPKKAMQVWLAFLALHFGYGLGYLEGILDFLVLRRQPRAGNAQLTR